LSLEDSYINQLKELCADTDRVKLIPPVKREEIIPFIQQYDIGIFILPDKITSLKFALPNKFFDFIQARLAVAVGPSVEMKKITEQYALGLVANDFEPATMAKALMNTTAEEINHFKQNAHKAASVFNNEVEEEKLAAELMKLL